MNPTLSISIVSHGQRDLVGALFGDLARLKLDSEILLTLNLPEPEPPPSAMPLRVIRNSVPKGFGANHNSAFDLAQGEYFCVLNPDVRVAADIFTPLIGELRKQPRLGLIAPKVITPAGELEDSARRFPTMGSLALKSLGIDRRLAFAESALAYPDWIAGMFMLFPRSVFREAGGFDPGYFLYYEDADLCARLRKLGYDVGYCPAVSIVHDARRTSRRSLRYLRWHLQSMLRFLTRRAMGRL